MPKLIYRTPKMCRDHTTAVVYVDGQRIRLGRWGSPEAKEAYDRVLAEWLHNDRRLPPPAQHDQREDSITVTELCVAFMRYAESEYKPNEAANYRSALRIIRQLYGSEPASNFGSRALAVVRTAMVEGDPEAVPPRRPWARSHINKQVWRVRSVFRWGVAEELVPSEVVDKLNHLKPLRKGKAKREGRKVVAVDRFRVRSVRPHISRQVRALIDLQLLTGARADELVRLRAVDLDTSRRVWTVTYDGSDEQHRHKTAHHGKTRIIYFGRRAQRVLRLFMRPERSVKRPLFSPRDAEVERYAQCRTHGKRKPSKTGRTLRDAYCTTTYRNAIYNACDKAGVPRWSPHQLRHAAAVSTGEKFSVEHSGALLGHSSVKMAQHYAKVTDKRAREVAEGVG